MTNISSVIDSLHFYCQFFCCKGIEKWYFCQYKKNYFILKKKFYKNLLSKANSILTFLIFLKYEVTIYLVKECSIIIRRIKLNNFLKKCLLSFNVQLSLEIIFVEICNFCIFVSFFYCTFILVLFIVGILIDSYLLLFFQLEKEK